MASTAQIPEATSAAPRRRIILRPLVAAIAGLTACGLLVWLAFQSGGYFPHTFTAAGAISFAVLCGLLAVHPPRHRLSGPALLALASLAGLAAWTALSSTWSATPDTALEDFQRTLAYLGLFGLGLLCAGSGRYSRHLLWGLLAVGTVVLGAAVLDRLYPGTPVEALDRFALYRLAHPLTYWNAVGALGAMTLVLGAGLAADHRSHPVLRGLAAGAATIAGIAAYLSFSRGAWLAFFTGAAALAILAPSKLRLLVSTAVIQGALAIALLRLAGLDGLTEGPGAGDGQAAEGRAFAPWLALCAGGAALLQGLIAWPRIDPLAQEQLSRLGRRAAVAVCGLVVVASFAVYITHTGRVEGEAASRLVSASSWVERQWDDFMAPADFSASGSERLTTAKGTRSDLYRVAIDGFEADPLRGDGSGAFEVRFAHDRRVAEKVRDAHSLYLETAGELGGIGVLLLAGLIAAIVWAGVSARLRPRALGRTQGAAAAAAVSVWMVHAAVDWDWQVPALTGFALLLAATLMPTGLSSRRVRSRSAARYF